MRQVYRVFDQDQRPVDVVGTPIDTCFAWTAPIDAPAGKGACLTHVPTGLRIWDVLSLRAAKAIVRELRGVPGIDWTRTDTADLAADLLMQIAPVSVAEWFDLVVQEAEMKPAGDHLAYVLRTKEWRGSEVTEVGGGHRLVHPSGAVGWIPKGAIT